MNLPPPALEREESEIAVLEDINESRDVYQTSNSTVALMDEKLNTSLSVASQGEASAFHSATEQSEWNRTQAENDTMLQRTLSKHAHPSAVHADGMYRPLRTPSVHRLSVEERAANHNSLRASSSAYSIEDTKSVTSVGVNSLYEETSKRKRLIVPSAPHMTIPERHRYTFAIVLRNADQVKQHLQATYGKSSIPDWCERNITALTHDMHKKCLRRLVQAGLGVSLLTNEEGSQNQICALVDPHLNKELLAHEFKREKDELAIKNGEATSRLGHTTLEDIEKLCFSPALELQLTHNIITNAFRDYDRDEWAPFDGQLQVSHVVLECFPLHDREFNNIFFAEYRKNTFDIRIDRATTGNTERWAIEELRLHFGERVAFLFAFMHVYNKLLLPLTAFGILYYLAFRLNPGDIWQEYMQGLSVLGFAVASMWGPTFLLVWQRETNLLAHKWNLKLYQETIYEKNDENPSFKYKWVRNSATGEMEKVPANRKRRLIRLIMFFVVLVCALLQCVMLTPFIQWYVFAKQAPVCSVCVEEKDDDYLCLQFLTCFSSETSLIGTDRWLYILVQGILLGLTIDIVLWEIFNKLSSKFVEWENYASRSEHENRLVHRRFVFVWSNWFFWFLFLAFVYLPFGEKINNAFDAIGLSWFSSFQWDPQILTLDTLFVTPLVVTQFLNLFLETAVPYLVRKCSGRTIGCRKLHVLGKRTAKEDRSTNNFGSLDLDVHALAFAVGRETQFSVPVRDVGDDSNAYSSAEIISESKLTIFDPMSDYLDAAIQFSYVIMFTVVWPLLPLPAFFNNLLEVRGDSFRLLFAQRRPMPKRDSSIGEWLTVLQYASYIGIIVVAGIIYMYHSGFWYTGCTATFSDATFIPFTAFLEASTDTRCQSENSSLVEDLVLLLLIEHAGLLLRHLVLQGELNPSSISSPAFKRLKKIEELSLLKSAPGEQFEYLRQVRLIFDKFDVSKDGYLQEGELVAFLAEYFSLPHENLELKSNSIIRYMDKNRLGKIGFADCALLLQNVLQDRFLARVLGLRNNLDDHRNALWRRSEDAMLYQEHRDSSGGSLLALIEKEKRTASVV